MLAGSTSSVLLLGPTANMRAHTHTHTSMYVPQCLSTRRCCPLGVFQVTQIVVLSVSSLSSPRGACMCDHTCFWFTGSDHCTVSHVRAHSVWGSVALGTGAPRPCYPGVGGCRLSSSAPSGFCARSPGPARRGSSVTRSSRWLCRWGPRLHPVLVSCGYQKRYHKPGSLKPQTFTLS